LKISPLDKDKDVPGKIFAIVKKTPLISVKLVMLDVTLIIPLMVIALTLPWSMMDAELFLYGTIPIVFMMMKEAITNGKPKQEENGEETDPNASWVMSKTKDTLKVPMNPIAINLNV